MTYATWKELEVLRNKQLAGNIWANVRNCYLAIQGFLTDLYKVLYT